MTSLKTIREHHQQLNTCNVRGLAAFCFYPMEEKIVNKSCCLSFFKVQTGFTLISRPDKHAELLKIYFKPLVKKLVAKSDLRFKIHFKWEKIINYEPVHVG